MKRSEQRGFTLIELLTSILLIVVMTGIALVIINPAQVRGRARDGRRVSDIMTIKTALEQYFLERRAYPASVPGGIGGSFIRIDGSADALSVALLNAKVLPAIPVDPIGTGSLPGPCSLQTNTTNYRYNYWAPARSNDVSSFDYYNSDKFMLTAIMETATSNDGNECGRLVSWGSRCSADGPACPGNGLSGNDPTFPSCDYCFGVEGK